VVVGDARWVELDEGGMLLLELLARVEDVGIVALVADCFLAASLRAEEEVAEEMMRSMCDAMLSEDSVRRS